MATTHLILLLQPVGRLVVMVGSSAWDMWSVVWCGLVVCFVGKRKILRARGMLVRYLICRTGQSQALITMFFIGWILQRMRWTGRRSLKLFNQVGSTIDCIGQRVILLET